MKKTKNMGECYTGKNKNSALSKTTVRRSPFVITIDDGYCKWEFGFNPINADDMCIEDITDVLEEHFNTKMVYSELVE